MELQNICSHVSPAPLPAHSWETHNLSPGPPESSPWPLFLPPGSLLFHKNSRANIYHLLEALPDFTRKAVNIPPSQLASPLQYLACNFLCIYHSAKPEALKKGKLTKTRSFQFGDPSTKHIRRILGKRDARMPEWTGLMLFHKIELLHDAPVKHMQRHLKKLSSFQKVKTNKNPNLFNSSNCSKVKHSWTLHLKCQRIYGISLNNRDVPKSRLTEMIKSGMVATYLKGVLGKPL